MRQIGPRTATAFDAERRVLAPVMRGFFPMAGGVLRPVLVLALTMSLVLGPTVAASAAPTTATACLVDSSGTGIEGAQASYYASGWKGIGATGVDGCVSTDAPAAAANFRLTYNGQTQETTQNTTTDPTITFQTGRVKQGLGQQVQSWYGSGWRPFADGLELLPGRVSFSLNDATSQVHTVVAGATIYVPTAPNAPSVAAGTDSSANEGDVVVVEATFTDQEVSESHVATVTWGDGSAPQTVEVSQSDGLAGVVAARHRYGDDGAYTAEVCVSDNGSIAATGCSVFTVAIANVAPEIVVTGLPESVIEGSDLALSATVTDPGVDDAVAVAWSVTDGGGDVVATGTGIEFSFTPADDGIYTVTAFADDGDGGTASVDETVTVANVLELLTRETAAIVVGDTSWVALNWQAARALEDFRVEVSSAGAATVTYSETTGGYAGPFQSANLAAGEIDFTSLRVHVPYGGHGDAETIPLEVVASWSVGGERVSLVFEVAVPLARHSGDDLTQLTGEIELATGAGAWVEVAYTGLTPAASNFVVVVRPNPDLPIAYPRDGDATSLSNDAVLEDGETDVARFYVDATETPPGRYALDVGVAYSRGSTDATFEGTVTVIVTP